jgi:hypothetical protein
MKAAVPVFIIGTAVLFLLCGCVTSPETPLRPAKPCFTPDPLKIAVLPPRIHPDLYPENLKTEKPIGQLFFDGRGVVITSADASKDIGLSVVSALTQAGKYERIFTVENEEEARKLGAEALMMITVWDYRTVLLGSNKNYFWMLATSPLMSQYWIKWRVIEARLEWEVKVTSLSDGSTISRNRLKKSYTASVRHALGRYFTQKMLSFLQYHVTPAYIGELFELTPTAEPPAEPQPPAQDK